SSRADLVGLVLPPGLGVLAAVLMAALPGMGAAFAWAGALLMLGLPLAAYAVVCRYTDRPLWFGLPVGIILLAALTGVNTQGQLVHSERGFFGVHRVPVFTEEDTGTEYVQLYHGSPVHGRQRQSRDPARRREPLTYYHPRGPIGQVFTALSGTSAK